MRPALTHRLEAGRYFREYILNAISGISREEPGSSGMADQCGLGRTRADGTAENPGHEPSQHRIQDDICSKRDHKHQYLKRERVSSRSGHCDSCYEHCARPQPKEPNPARHRRENVRGQVNPYRYQQSDERAPSCTATRLHGSLGQPPTGRFLEISFRIASFQSPSILRTSGIGPGRWRGFLALGFDFFAAFKMASPVSESAEALALVDGSAVASRRNS